MQLILCAGSSLVYGSIILVLRPNRVILISLCRAVTAYAQSTVPLMNLFADYDSPWMSRATMGAMLAQYVVSVLELLVLAVATVHEIKLHKHDSDIRCQVFEEVTEAVERNDHHEMEARVAIQPSPSPGLNHIVRNPLERTLVAEEETFGHQQMSNSMSRPWFRATQRFRCFPDQQCHSHCPPR
eukprot:PhM_4_TR13910/c1_g3_i5/m.39871